MKGTWQTTDHGGGAGPALLVIAAVLLLGSGGAVAAAVTDALWAVSGVVLLSAGTLAGLLIRHARHPEAVSRIVPRPQFHELGGERPELGRTVPRELHQHTHYHWHGAQDGGQRAEIIRRSQRPE